VLAPPSLLEADDNVLYVTAGDALDGATLGHLLDLATATAAAMIEDAERPEGAFDGQVVACGRMSESALSAIRPSLSPSR
jgi:hypothetical protein